MDHRREGEQMQVVDTTKQENTTQEINEFEIYDNEIKLQLDNFCNDFQIEDMSKESQNKWNAALLYIYKYVFKDTNKLKDKTNISNRYNIDMVNSVCDIYINYCYLYDKEISIMGFSKLTGIDTDTINSWGNNEYMASSNASVIHKKLTKEREESLSNILISGKRNPVGILGALNRHYQWNMPGVNNRDNTKTLNKQTPEQIAKQYNNGVIDISTAAELPPV
jgi:hypothetical protein